MSRHLLGTGARVVMTEPRTKRDDGLEHMSSGLGLFSLALGTSQTLFPDRVDRLIGVEDDDSTRTLQRVIGMRELAAAAGILGRRRTTAWLWARVVGDVMDLALLGFANTRKERAPRRLAIATGAVVGVLGADTYTALRNSERKKRRQRTGSSLAETAITIRRPREELFRRFRDLIVARDNVISFGPVEVLAEDPGLRIAFRMSADHDHARGVAMFVDAPADRGTEIHLRIEQQRAPIGSAVEKLRGAEPLQRAKDGLLRFRQLMETGEVVRSEGALEGPARPLLRQRPAQPVDRANS
ncbi:MAG: cyclase/dehydrase [Acidimicrobiaceae bacterium]|nr:cyclase/dehydrase [Acidimicrobiaceae bacterium]